MSFLCFPGVTRRACFLFILPSAVTADEARTYAEKLNIPFIETSAKNADNVEQAFLTMAAELIKIRNARGASAGNAAVDLKAKKKSSKGCC